MRLDQPTPASLVGRWVDTPAREFKTKGDAYRGKMISVDTARAQHVVVKFQDDPTIKYFFPVTSVVKWLVDVLGTFWARAVSMHTIFPR